VGLMPILVGFDAYFVSARFGIIFGWLSQSDSDVCGTHINFQVFDPNEVCVDSLVPAGTHSCSAASVKKTICGQCGRVSFVEGLNNKIRVIQRRAYGLRDEEYLRLKVLTCMLPNL
jgi:Transposase